MGTKFHPPEQNAKEWYLHPSATFATSMRFFLQPDFHFSFCFPDHFACQLRLRNGSAHEPRVKEQIVFVHLSSINFTNGNVTRIGPGREVAGISKMIFLWYLVCFQPETLTFSHLSTISRRIVALFGCSCHHWLVVLIHPRNLFVISTNRSFCRV